PPMRHSPKTEPPPMSLLIAYSPPSLFVSALESHRGSSGDADSITAWLLTNSSGADTVARKWLQTTYCQVRQPLNFRVPRPLICKVRSRITTVFPSSILKSQSCASRPLRGQAESPHEANPCGT